MLFYYFVGGGLLRLFSLDYRVEVQKTHSVVDIDRIAVTGGNGLLGRQLKKDSKGLIMTNFSKEMCTIGSNLRFDELLPFNTIIHAAAKIDVNEIETKKDEFIHTNIIGTANLSRFCINNNKRLIYISTDYVYDGISGNHSEDDPINPYNLYAWSKLGGESSVKFVPNHVIVRTSFGKSEFPYENAYDNLYTSKDYVDVISPMIINICKNKDFKGVINVGTKRKSIYDYATTRNTDINKSSLHQTKDFSLNTRRYEEFFEKN